VRLQTQAIAGGGEVIGVIPQFMVAKELAHDGLTELIVVDSMYERKNRLAQLADAFVALPGGIGTLEEVIEMFTWLQIGIHLKPVGLLNAHGFYDPLLKFLAHMRGQQFLTPAHYAMLTVENNLESLLDRLSKTKHTHFPKLVKPARDRVR
jgi:uncharacterized protein (TIGR00730 family)